FDDPDRAETVRDDDLAGPTTGTDGARHRHPVGLLVGLPASARRGSVPRVGHAIPQVGERLALTVPHGQRNQADPAAALVPLGQRRLDLVLTARGDLRRTHRAGPDGTA